MTTAEKTKMKTPRVFLNKARRDEQAFEKTTVQGGIIGMTGTGKSSLINALAGRDIAEVGVNETTGVSANISAYEFHNIALVDLPGVGTEKWQTETYFSDLLMHSPVQGKYSLQPQDFDFFVLVFANRILEEDLKLYRLITIDLKKRCFLVRSKFDIDADNNKRTKRKSDKETYQEIKRELWQSFPDKKTERVFIISSAEPARGDFEKLEAAIQKALPKMKSEKFLAFAMAYSAEGLKKKRKVANKHALRVALLSAANALNPIPGIGLMADVGLLLKLSHDLMDVYGLTDEQLDHEFRSQLKTKTQTLRYKRKIMNALKPLLSFESIVTVLQRFGYLLETKELAKWLPYAGQAVAVILSYHLTSSYAREAITLCEVQALQIFQNIRESK